MSAGLVTAYLTPTMARKRAIRSGDRGGVGWTIFILVSCSYSFPPHRGAAQPVVDRLADPVMARKRAIRPGDRGGVGWTIFILVSCSYSFPPHRGAAQPVVDRLAEPVMRHRHHPDGARALRAEGA